MANIETISSLEEVNNVLENRGIDHVDRYNEVQFRLNERSSLLDAAEIKARTRAGRRGFRLLNPELLDCKNYAKIRVERAYNRLFRQCMQQYDQELAPLEVAIAELRRRLLLPEDQIANSGPDIMQRNRGVPQVIYPHPPFPVDPDYEHGANQNQHQPAYATAAERNEAIARDKRAQRACWTFNLSVLELKKKILEDKRLELERGLKAEYEKATENQSDLGVGYADFDFLHA